MRKLEDILKSIGQNIFFSKQEKKVLRENLEAYLKFHPVRMEEGERLHVQRSSVLVYSLQVFLRKKTMPIILILALMFGGGGVSYAAEGAVPGDALYPIKVSVNEEVRDLVAFTPEAKAGWATRLVERRLEEAEVLAIATGEIPPAAQDVIEEKLEKHIEKLESNLSRVEEKRNVEGASEISAKLETTLRSHIAVLEKVKEKQARKSVSAASLSADADEDVRDEDEALVATEAFSKDRLTTLTDKLSKSAEKIALRREAHLATLAFEDAPERFEAAQNQKNVAEKKMAEFSRLFEANGKELSDATRARLEEGISQMKEAFRKGEEALVSKKYGEAFVYFQEAGAMAQKLMIFMRSESKLDIAVSDKGTFKKPLVRLANPIAVGEEVSAESGTIAAPDHEPVSEETRKDAAEAMLRKAGIYLEETNKLFEEHQEKLPDDIAKRIETNIKSAEELISEGKRAFDAGEYGTAYLAGQKAINLLSELQQVIRKYISSNNGGVNEEVRRAREVAAGALEKAKQAISSADVEDEAIRKAKALYEEAHLAFSQGERAMKAGAPKEAIEFFKKTVRIVEEIIRLLRSANTDVGIVKPLPVEPMPAPVPEPIVCTKEYAPVCGTVKTNIVCVTTPCDNTTEKTFGNACEARVAGATVVYKGECRLGTTTSSSVETSVKETSVVGTTEAKTDEATKAETANTTETKTEEAKTDNTRYYSY